MNNENKMFTYRTVITRNHYCNKKFRQYLVVVGQLCSTAYDSLTVRQVGFFGKSRWQSLALDEVPRIQLPTSLCPHSKETQFKLHAGTVNLLTLSWAQFLNYIEGFRSQRIVFILQNVKLNDFFYFNIYVEIKNHLRF